MLTRDILQLQDYRRYLGLPASETLSEGQLRQSLIETLIGGPEGRELWIFAYGSLMWNPLLSFDRMEVARLEGWRRSFCLEMVAGRAAPESPGRMLALVRGGATDGLAFRLSRETLAEDLDRLWTREMIVGSYCPLWAPVRFRDGRKADAITFVADVRQAHYRPGAAVSEVAGVISGAVGPMGRNTDYVFSLDSALRANALRDDYVSDLAAALVGAGSQRPDSGSTIDLTSPAHTCSSAMPAARCGSISNTTPSACATHAASTGNSQVRNS